MANCGLTIFFVVALAWFASGKIYSTDPYPYDNLKRLNATLTSVLQTKPETEAWRTANHADRQKDLVEAIKKEAGKIGRVRSRLLKAIACEKNDDRVFGKKVSALRTASEQMKASTANARQATMQNLAAKDFHASNASFSRKAFGTCQENIVSDLSANQKVRERLVELAHDNIALREKVAKAKNNTKHIFGVLARFRANSSLPALARAIQAALTKRTVVRDKLRTAESVLAIERERAEARNVSVDAPVGNSTRNVTRKAVNATPPAPPANTTPPAPAPFVVPRADSGDTVVVGEGDGTKENAANATDAASAVTLLQLQGTQRLRQRSHRRALSSGAGAEEEEDDKVPESHSSKQKEEEEEEDEGTGAKAKAAVAAITTTAAAAAGGGGGDSSSLPPALEAPTDGSTAKLLCDADKLQKALANQEVAPALSAALLRQCEALRALDQQAEGDREADKAGVEGLTALLRRKGAFGVVLSRQLKQQLQSVESGRAEWRAKAAAAEKEKASAAAALKKWQAEQRVAVDHAAIMQAQRAHAASTFSTCAQRRAVTQRTGARQRQELVGAQRLSAELRGQIAAERDTQLRTVATLTRERAERERAEAEAQQQLDQYSREAGAAGARLTDVKQKLRVMRSEAVKGITPEEGSD